MYKPCPFCGVEQIGNATTYIEAEIVGLPDLPGGRPTDRPLAAVKCWNCFAYGPAKSGGNRDQAIAIATARWNERATPAYTPARGGNTPASGEVANTDKGES